MKRSPEIAKGAPDDRDVTTQRVIRTVAGTTPLPLTSAPRSVFSNSQGAAKKSTERSRLDPASVTIRKGVPIPTVQRQMRSAYSELWARMGPGDMVTLPDKQAASLVAYAKRVQGRFECRRMDVGIKGVWRTA